ncbi:MAG: AraC-like DNA-binding protein [Psychrosphaera sp.]|jgi:AraC-like DNA-binding protein
MEHLNIVNLIQSGTITVGILGGILLWKTYEYRGLSILLWLSAFASFINILEESGLTRGVYLISPVFIMLFGPAIYLSTRFIIEKKLKPYEWFHFLPVIPFLLFTDHTQQVIALGTFWRLSYSLMTVSILIKFKRMLDDQRSDSDDYSLNWLAWLVAITSTFTIIDLVRLNYQHSIAHELNVLGQGIQNTIWLISSMLITAKLIFQGEFVQSEQVEENHINKGKPSIVESEYSSIFSGLDELIAINKWYLTPRLTLNDLSQLTGLQSRDISRAINLCKGISFSEYINQYRVEHACHLIIKNPNMSLLDVASEAGFSSKASYNKVFKQVTGKTPSGYKSEIAV